MDQMLLEAFLEGDWRAFEQWVLLHRKAAVLFALRITRNLPAAEDAVQEAFAWILAHRERIRPEYGLRPLLYTLVRRRCADWFRSLRRQVSLDELMEKGEYAPEAVYQEEKTRSLYHALEALNPRHARVVHLLDLEGFTQREAAWVLGTTEGAVKALHHRAKAQLRSYLQEEEARDDA